MQRCRHFGECGGCATQDVAYPDQVRAKEAALRERLGIDVPVAPSPVPFGYRTRMDYVYAWGKLGLRKKGDGRSVLELDECLLPPPRAFEAVLKVREELRRLDIRSYQYLRHRGYLRYVSVRAAPRSGELMLVFLTNGTDEAIVPVLDAAADWADSVVWCVTGRTADVSFGEPHAVRHRDWIEEDLGGVRLRFGAQSFFQSNSWLAEDLYRWVAARASGRVVDLCCGVGGFSLFLDDACDVLGIDNNAEGIAFARHNAAANGRDNVVFEVADQREFLKRAQGCDTLILDPPRAGLGDKSVRRLARLGVPRLIYVSCNAKVLARELPHFRGYEPVEWQGFDLFPQTPHVETVVVLERSS